MTAAGAAAAPLLQIDALSVSIRGMPIVNNLSLSVGAGEILGLVGASGSGKTLTALAIMQLLPANSAMTGEIRLRGELLTGKSERELTSVRGRDLGLVFQEPMTALNPLMRIGDQVAETVRLHRAVSAAEAARMARDTLELVGLGGGRGAAHLLPYELSGGERQRVAIAMAVALEPPLLIADEPTTALDVSTQAHVLRLLEELAHSRHMGLILVTHDLAVVARVTDRVALLHRGEIVEQGATSQMLRHLQHPYGRALLAAARSTPKRRVLRPEASPPVLEVRDIVHDYPRRRRALWSKPPPLRAVDGASLSVHAGETVALVGESGSGKSSLLRVTLALEHARAGEVILLGEGFSAARGKSLRRLRRGIQAVFQDPYGSFDPRWSVERLVAEPYFLLDSPPDTATRRRKVAGLLELVGLSASDARRHPHEFSGGQRQRIAIARALITEPAVIAFDEAVSALDVLVRTQILELLAHLSERLGLAYLFVSHDLHVVRSIADRTYVMQRGRIVEHGPTEAIFTSPQHAYTQALIAAAPKLDDPN
ncbi:MAG: ABC transporter ATP-binding protein [Steroidobacteraceae bacterium]